MAKRQRSTLDLLALISLLFFISGSTGLAYEVIWSRRFTHIWGSSSLAMASVVASFLFGLGLGALLLGRVADRMKKPLLWYGIAEIAIGVLALIIPFEIVALSELAIQIHPSLPDVESLRFLVRCGLTLLVIGPPCVLMGGTLPLLIRQFTPRDGELGAVVGWLYAINTFGAATGCAMAGFYLLPWLGLANTNYVTAAVNLLIGGVSIALSMALATRLDLSMLTAAPSAPAKSQTPPQPRPRPTATPHSVWGVYFAVALTGLAALILQMVWVRQLSLVLGGSTYAFTATLFVVLVAIALGSLLYQIALQRFVANVYLPIAVIGLLTLSTVMGTLLLPWLSEYASGFRETRWQWSVNATLCILAAAIVQLLPGIAMGILFPLLVDLTHAAAAVVGRTVGNVYAWNTLGSIVGATFSSFYLFPWLGTIGTVAFALALYFAAGALMLLPLGFAPRRLPVWGAYAAAATAIVGGVCYYQSQANPLDTNFGLYMYDIATRKSNIVVPYFAEGASSNVLVIEYANPKQPDRPPRSLRVNGKVDASTELDMPTQLGLAYFPRFFNAHAKKVLVIGFGSGTTSGASLLFPDTDVTCCEIEPAVYEASPQFAAVNHSPEKKTRKWLEAHNATLPAAERLTPEQIDEQARFEIVFGDGRTVLQTSPHNFDLIISEPSNPWLAGVSNLFTREFFSAAKQHLNEGGVLAQWIQTYNFTVAEYALIVRTMREIFPYAGVVCLTRGADTILLASTEPLTPSQADLEYLDSIIASTPEIKTDLETRFPATDVRRLLLQHYYLDQEGLDRFVAGDLSPGGRAKEINTDLNMKLEFDAPLQLFAKNAVDVFPSMIKASAPGWTKDLAIRLGRSPSTPEFYTDLAAAAIDRQQFDQAAEYYQQAMREDPKYLPAYKDLAALYQRLKKNSQAIDVLLQLVRLLPNEPVLRVNLAVMLGQEKRPAQAIEQYRAALRIRPDFVLAANNLAWILATHPNEQFRDGEESLRLAKQACDATKNSIPGFLDTLAAAYAELGQYEDAIRALKAATTVAQQRNEMEFVAASKGRLDLYLQGRPYREG